MRVLKSSPILIISYAYRYNIEIETREYVQV